MIFYIFDDFDEFKILIGQIQFLSKMLISFLIFKSSINLMEKSETKETILEED